MYMVHNYVEIEQQIACFINRFSEHCESLLTFTLHILSDSCCAVHDNDMMHEVLDLRPEGPAALALVNLVPKVRDLITIVAFGNCNSCGNLLYDISKKVRHEHGDFAYGRLNEWPAMELRDDQLAALHDVWRSGYHRDGAIHAWVFKLPTSELANDWGLAVWEFLGPTDLYCRDQELEDRAAIRHQEHHLEVTLALRSGAMDAVGDSEVEDQTTFG